MAQGDQGFDSPTAWKPLRYFNLYRVILSGLFVVLVGSENLPTPLGSDRPQLFAIVTVVYFLLAIAAQFAIAYARPNYEAQVLGHVLIDILAITLMMFASGGVTSGIGMLLVVSIAGGSILTAGRTAVLFAAIASLAVLAEELYSWPHLDRSSEHYTQAGLLGATFFATALLGHALARRVRASEALAAQRGVDLADLARLNEQIVQRMRSGIIVLDAECRVRLANTSALALFGHTGPYHGMPLNVVMPEFSEQISSWLQQPRPATRFVRPASRETDLLVSLADLGPDRAAGALIFLEDAAIMRQRAQQLKLASLGRLTASIAHEIRNPVGAISHASQLLQESAAIIEADRRLTRIIHEHSERVNTIIENVLMIGRRDNPAPETFNIQPWLEAFVQELSERRHLERGQVTLTAEPLEIRVQMDRSQLHQVLWNLCENGLRYSAAHPSLELRCGTIGTSERPYLDVIDHGPGIPDELAEQIFEPFFTGEPKGTGLGLYIAAELCESNQASLSLHSNSEQGCCFRISFAHPDRQQLVAF